MIENIGSLALAYLGDAIYEVYVRKFLLSTGQCRPNRLHIASTKFVSAKAQCAVICNLVDRDFLTEDEMAVYKRARNAKSGTIPKNTSIMTYKHATGFEALIGYLHLTEQTERLEEIMKEAVKFCQGDLADGK